MRFVDMNKSHAQDAASSYEKVVSAAARYEPPRAEVKRLSSEQLTKLKESVSPDSSTRKTPYVGVYVEKF
jgi:hypothetical protein